MHEQVVVPRFRPLSRRGRDSPADDGGLDPRGWFVYCNARRDLEAFDAHLEFRIKLIPYDGGDGWIEKTLADIHRTLRADKPPAVNRGCEYCRFSERSGAAGSE